MLARLDPGRNGFPNLIGHISTETQKMTEARPRRRRCRAHVNTRTEIQEESWARVPDTDPLADTRTDS